MPPTTEAMARMKQEIPKDPKTLRPKKCSKSKNSSSKATSSMVIKARSLVFRYINILQWLPNYKKDDIVCDAIAGFTIGLTMLPQSIAYALLAGLSPQYGLYSSFVGTLIYIVLGTVKEVTIGPTSLMALLTFEFTQDLSVDFVVLLTFLTGCVELLFGILRLGVLVDFISTPVVSGFTSATSIVIAEAQMKGLLGIKYKSVGFLDNTWKLFSNIHHTKLGDALLGVSSIIFLLTFRKLKDIPIGPRKKNTVDESEKIQEGKDQINESKKSNEVLKKTLWFLTIGRNALIVLICATTAFIFEYKWGKAPFALSGQINPGFPPFRPPPFSTVYGNETYTFGGMVSELKSGIIIVPVVSVLVNVAIAKAFATGGQLYATQEMITLGICNVAGSFVSSMPTCGAFTRSAVSSASGIRTPLAGLYTGSLILLALGFLTPYFYYIPRSTLSAVLISAVIFMADFKIFKILWQTSKRDLFAATVTFVGCLCLGIEMGLLLGVAINCVFLLYLWARPQFYVEHKKSTSSHEYLLVTPDVGLYFPSIEFVRTKVGGIGITEGGGILPLVLNCCHFKGLDYSTAKGMEQIINEYRKRQQTIVLLKLRKEALTFMEELDVKDIVHCCSEEELDTLLFGENVNRDVGLMIDNTKKIYEEEVGLPLLERHVALEEIVGDNDLKSMR